MYSDNATNMTSPDVGSQKYIEDKLGHSTQRLNCVLHVGELPPKNLAKALDGDTKSPIGTGGPMGDAVRSLPENLAKMPFVDGFICIPTYVDKDFDIGVFQGRSDLVKLYDFAIAIGKKHILQVMNEF